MLRETLGSLGPVTYNGGSSRKRITHAYLPQKLVLSAFGFPLLEKLLRFVAVLIVPLTLYFFSPCSVIVFRLVVCQCYPSFQVVFHVVVNCFATPFNLLVLSKCSRNLLKRQIWILRVECHYKVERTRQSLKSRTSDRTNRGFV